LGQQKKRIYICFAFNRVQLVHSGVQRIGCSRLRALEQFPFYSQKIRDFLNIREQQHAALRRRPLVKISSNQRHAWQALDLKFRDV
jgi:hypothetical protein